MRRDVFQAIADPTRREIISLISAQTMNLNAVADKFEISRPAISKHIKILNECGLIEIKQEGRERLCMAQLEPLKQVTEWLIPYQSFWSGKLDALDIHLTKKQRKKIAKRKAKKNKHGK